MASNYPDELLTLLCEEPKTTNYKKCVICQADSNETLRKGRETSINTLISSLQIRNDNQYERLKSDFEALPEIDVLWHSKCYAIITSKTNLESCRKSKISPSTLFECEPVVLNETKRQSRVSLPDFDKYSCIFCKHKTYKKDKTLFNVCSFDACETIKAAAEVREDEEMLHLLRSINFDLIAAEVKYHSNCRSKYVSQRNIEKTGITSDNIYEIAFQSLISEIDDNITAGKAYDMGNLIEIYHNKLRLEGFVTQINYSKHKLKMRLLKHYKDQIVFHVVDSSNT